MGKIINVDFKNKKTQFTWDEDDEMRQKVTKQVDEDFRNILDKIVYLTQNDRKFQEYCAMTLGAINANLRGRLG